MRVATALAAAQSGALENAPNQPLGREVKSSAALADGRTASFFRKSWHHSAMSGASILDMTSLRRGCGQCSLHQLCLPAGLDVDELGKLDGIVRRRKRVERGERLYRAGDPLSAIYVVREGAFKTISVSEEGEEQVVGFHLPGELIGLDALGEGAHRCEAIALASSNVCEVPFDQLAAITVQLPSLQQQLLRVIGQSADRRQDHLGMLLRRQAGERIALFLHSLTERYSNIGQSATRFKLPMSREEIARYLGLALETVSRGFSRLEDDGVIEVVGRNIEILDLAELGRRAHDAENDEPRRRRRA